MATPINKHKLAQRIFYSSFDGGLNLDASPETLSKNELKEAINVEVSPFTGKLKVRGGLVFSGNINTRNRPITSITPLIGGIGYLISYQINTRRYIVYYDGGIVWGIDGFLNGSGDISAVVWDNSVLIASGGKLQSFTMDSAEMHTFTLQTIDNSPSDCQLVFVRSGRVGVVCTDDTIRFSHIGDCQSWNNVASNPSTGQYIQIGYKDGMNIDAVIPLSKDLIIFKSPNKNPSGGIIWRLTGDFPNWAIVEVARNTGTYSQRSVQVVANDVFYVTDVGVTKLSSVTDYGEIKTTWFDRKVSKALAALINSSCELWHIPTKQQLWVLPSSNEEKLWIFDYSRGIWTNFIFPELPTYTSSIKNTVFVFIGNYIYNLNDTYTRDEIHGDDPYDITASIRLGALLTSRQILIKGVYATYEADNRCQAALYVENFRLPLPYRGIPNYIYDNENCIYDYTALIFPPEEDIMTSRMQCIVRDWIVTPEIKVTGGGFSISTMGFDIVEV